MEVDSRFTCKCCNQVGVFREEAAVVLGEGVSEEKMDHLLCGGCGEEEQRIIWKECVYYRCEACRYDWLQANYRTRSGVRFVKCTLGVSDGLRCTMCVRWEDLSGLGFEELTGEVYTVNDEEVSKSNWHRALTKQQQPYRTSRTAGILPARRSADLPSALSGERMAVPNGQSVAALMEAIALMGRLTQHSSQQVA